MLKQLKNGSSLLVLSAILMSLAASVPAVIADATLSPAMARGGDSDGGRGGDDRGGDDRGGRGGDDRGGDDRGGRGSDDRGSDDRGGRGGDDRGGDNRGGRGSDDRSGRSSDDDSGRGRGRGRGGDDRTQAGSQADDRTRTQARTRTRGADDLVIRRLRAGALDDNGGRIPRDRRFEPGDDRRRNGQ